MKFYALLDYEILVKKEWAIERFISICKALHVEINQYKDKTKNDVIVLKESLSDLARLSFKPIGVIGGVRVNDKIDGVTYAVIGSDLYEY